jgi:hypothetical protein
LKSSLRVSSTASVISSKLHLAVDGVDHHPPSVGIEAGSASRRLLGGRTHPHAHAHLGPPGWCAVKDDRAEDGHEDDRQNRSATVSATPSQVTTTPAAMSRATTRRTRAGTSRNGSRRPASNRITPTATDTNGW